MANGKRFTNARLKVALTEEEVARMGRLRGHVEMLSEVIGIRNTERPGGLEAAARYIEDRLKGWGYEVGLQEYRAGGMMVRNIEVEIGGVGRRRDEILILCAHYDSVDVPAANDNGSGVAGVLEAAQLWAGKKFGRTVRLVFFVNEEPPYYKGEFMGSVRYARRSKERGEKIVGVVNLETIGCYYAEQGSQQYPRTGRKWLDWGMRRLPQRGDFVLFTGNMASTGLIWKVWRGFKTSVRFRAFGVPAPAGVMGPDMSDQWSFWQEGFPAIMVTDTAMMRYSWYHTAKDLPGEMNFECMTRVVGGVIGAVEGMAGRG